MTTTDPPVAGNGDEDGGGDNGAGSTQRLHQPEDRVGQLRGAGVSVDARRVGQVALGIVLVTLAVLAVVFTIVGIHTNQQDDRLHDDGVPVTFTVTGCLGLLGGSGSNAAGYACRGTYTIDGKHYAGVQLPGASFHRPGSTVAAIVGLVISSASVNYAKSHNQSIGVYEKLTYVLLGLAILILLTSWLRKRLFQGITLALYGLAIFQLHYTYVGFAAPFLLAGAWYLVRAYRLQQELRRAEAAGPNAPRPKASPGAAPPRPRRNKRYTPPS